ncbi:unnamed protein product [Peniophora sp. CBMAI 1063]|nr:unnamed protein product [Peniophora sp. CBMAI 1063]
MAAVDPTYPLYPVASILASAMLFLVLLTSFVRQTWNLGVTFLSFWLFWENLAQGIDTIIWSDNADVKLYVYCDIVSHLQMLAFVVKPMATLIITRRLYLITNRRGVYLTTKSARRRNIAIEWTLGLGIPLLVAGPFYYVVQWSRFEIVGGFGCNNSPDASILAILLIKSWTVIPSLVSIIVYFPHVARVFYRHNREINHFLRSNDSVSRTNYFRIFALASIDVLLTLPIGIATIVISVEDMLSFGPMPFYFGWNVDHTDWQPPSITYDALVSEGTFSVAEHYFGYWTSPVLAFVIFGLFGVTPEARASYWRIVCTVSGWLGWKPTSRARRGPLSLGDIEFGERPLQDSLSLGLKSQPSSIEPHAHAQCHVVEIEGFGSELENGSDKDVVEDRHGDASNATLAMPSATFQGKPA